MLFLTNKTKLAISILALLSLGLVASTGIAYLQVRSSLLASLQQQQLLKANAASAELTEKLRQSLRLVSKFADTLAVHPGPWEDNPKLQFYIRQSVAAKQFDYLGYGLESNGYYWVNDWPTNSDFDPRQRPWYLASKSHFGPFITDPYTSVGGSGERFIAITAPIKKAGHFLGVVSGDISLTQIEQLIGRIRLTPGDQALLINKQGRILAHPEHSLDHSLTQLLGEPLPEQLTPGVLHQTEEVYFSATEIENADWLLLYAVPKARIQAAIFAETVTLLSYFLAVFLVVMAVFYTINRHIFAPLIDLLEKDSVTGLPGKKHFKQLVGAQLKRSCQQGILIIVSIDEFNQLTATYPAPTIKALLNQVRERIQQQLSSESLLGLFSESRFIAYIPTQLDDNDQTKQQLLSQLASRLAEFYLIDGREINCSFRQGASFYPQHGSDLDDLIDNAFSVMATAKNTQFNASWVYDPAINQQLSSDLLMANAIRNALRNGEFKLVYQPQYNLEKQRFCAMEALLRWHSAEFAKAVPPDRFIPVAERSNLIINIGDFVIESVLKQIRIWLDQQQAFGVVSVNLSPKQLLQPGFIHKLEGLMERYQVPCQYLELEITETSVLENPQVAMAILAELREKGFSIAIDDFGTGYASLQYLKAIPFDKLKVDRAFIKDLEQSIEDRVIVNMVMEMSRALHFQVVAEGADSQWQVDYLAKLGYHFIQGYYYARPMAADDVIKLLKD